MAIQVSYYGSKKPAAGIKPQRVITLPDNTPKDKLPFGRANPIDWMTGKHLVQFRKEDEGKGGGKMKADKSIVVNDSGEVELKGDQDSPGSDKVYGTGSSGVKGWRSAPKSVPDGEDNEQIIQILVWDTATQMWRTETLAQITVIVGWRLDRLNHVFQIQTRSCYVHSPGGVSEWTNIPDADGGVLVKGVTA